MKLAIVGTGALERVDVAYRTILKIIRKGFAKTVPTHESLIVLCRRRKGIDTMAGEIASALGLEIEFHSPDSILKSCDILYGLYRKPDSSLVARARQIGKKSSLVRVS